MRRRRIGVLALALAVSLTLAGCAGPEPRTGSSEDANAPVKTKEATADSELLTPADVEKVSGLTDLKVVPYHPSIGAGGQVNIAKADGQLVAMLSAQGPDTWKAWSTDGITFRQPYTPVVGDESYIGPKSSTSAAIYLFAFRKGDRAIVIDTYFLPGGSQTILSVEQLHDLAVLVESRL